MCASVCAYVCSVTKDNIDQSQKMNFALKYKKIINIPLNS